jgi:hypothetical protein
MRERRLARSSLSSSKSNVNKVGGPKGNPVAATINLTGPTDTQTVYTPTGGFSLMRVCVSPSNGGVRLDAGGFGSIAVVGMSGTPLCQEFLPDGVFILPGSAISCSISGEGATGYFCMISGVVQQ